MKRTINALLIALLAVVAASAALIGCTTASASDAPARGYEFRDISDYFAPRVPSGAVRVKQEMDARAAHEAAEAEEAAQEAWEAEQAYYADYSASYAPAWDSADGFYSQGVRGGVGSATETYYSSNNAYHYRTPEWTPDEEGYYRDADGYYVVSSDDYAEGEVVQTSKGEGRVYDGGSGSGNFDMYVNW